MNTANTCVFVVDPNKLERSELITRLQSNEYRTEGVSTGKDVLRKVKKMGRQIVILDLDIEDIDPYELIGKLQKKSKDLQVITITHNAGSKVRKKVAKMGVLFHSTKPKHLYQLKNIVDVTLEFENRRAEQTLA